MFDEASYQLIAEATGWNPMSDEWRHFGWADVRHVIEYKSEVHAGSYIEIFGGITKTGNSSIETYYEMRNKSTNKIAATLYGKTVYFDLKARRARPLTDTMLGSLQGFMMVPTQSGA